MTLKKSLIASALPPDDKKAASIVRRQSI